MREEEFQTLIGTDEVGKGDYFGPLVVAGVYVNSDNISILQKYGIRDSKELSDRRISELAPLISAKSHFSVVVIGPKRYNELYSKLNNLNLILAWGHARVIENLLSKVECATVLTDQFGSYRYVLNALMEKGKKIELCQRPKAEDNIAVASASILARNEFIRRLAMLSKEIDFELPKGASTMVEEKGKEIVRRHGIEFLKGVAKFHFKTTQKIIQELELGV